MFVHSRYFPNIGKEANAECERKWFDNGIYKGAPFEQHRYRYRNIPAAIEGREEYLIKEHQNLEAAKIIECFYRTAELGREVRACELTI